MKRRVGIIGMGWVGASVAISTLHSGITDQLLLHDLRADRAEGETMDLAHGGPFYPSATVRVGTIEEMVDADAVVVTAGHGGGPGQSRLELLRENAAVIEQLGQQLTRCRGTIIVVTNPVDVLTRLMKKASGLPSARVLGTGTMLDSARLRASLSKTLEIDAHSIHAYVVGEHGDSEVVLWSGARAGGVRLRDWPGWKNERETRIAHEVQRAAYEIIQRKGATNHAIGLATADLLRCILRGERRILTVSRVQEGAFGVSDIALSLPTVVGTEGATRIIEPEISADERSALQHSAEVLREAGRQVGLE
ncbi:MAG TPA: L-lactate dehydrogenase [Terriglobales bacterium]|nr:L-lactate dehydrogenase [Terriglobales bacterium]